jgi:hypothetical protein
MLLARPAYVAVAERVIIVWLLLCLSGAPQAVPAWAAILVFVALVARNQGSSVLGIRGGLPGASVIEALDRAVTADR